MALWYVPTPKDGEEDEDGEGEEGCKDAGEVLRAADGNEGVRGPRVYACVCVERGCMERPL